MREVFKREQRYLVIKLSDMHGVLSNTDLWHLEKMCKKVNDYRAERGKSWLHCVVVEHDWPEYEPTWRAIEKRMKKEGGK